MHKYFNFTKIFEAEQMGAPLDPTEMGTPEGQTNSVPTEKVEDFTILAKENILEITVTKDDFDKLQAGQSVEKTDALWKNTENNAETKGIKKVIFNIKNDEANYEPDALTFDLDEGVATDIIEGLKLGENVTQVLKGFSKAGTVVPEVTVKFIKSIDIDTSPDLETVPATPEQIESGAVLPEPTEGAMPNESRGIMSFDQFVNEGKKKWIGDVTKDMEKGALKKELGGKVTKARIKEEEAKLKKKDKDKKKPGLQLGAKDAKTHKRDVLAMNLLKAQKGKK